MNGKSGFLTKTIQSLLVLALVSFSLSNGYNYLIRTEACYIVNHPNTWGDWESNFYISSLFDYKLYTVEGLGVDVYTTPRVVYNYYEGLDVEVSLRLDIPLFGGGNTQNIINGASFPENFLNVCNIYVRHNIYGY